MRACFCNYHSECDNINLSAKLIVICTKCKCGIYSECEYGYGPKDAIIGDVDYFAALKNVEKYSQDSNKESILVRGLILSELENLRG